MELIENLINPLSVCGSIFFIMGLLTYKFPPKHINALYGYRTKSSMKNQHAWDFAQTYSAKKMTVIGLIMMLLSVNFIAFDFSSKQTLIISLIVIVFSVLYLLLKTENAIRDKFKPS